ncbi:MAG: flagellar protein FliS [Cellulosilyticaceae bacterium]
MITVSTVANATEIQLLCVTYELFLADIENARQTTGVERKVHIDRAREVLVTLSENLNFEVALAKELFDLYVYIQYNLMNHWKEDEKLEEIYRLIDMIYQGYLQVAQADTNQKPMMENTQAVYAGMTYGKGYLNEHTVDEPTRGYKA